jgi:hypothetical protein
VFLSSGTVGWSGFFCALTFSVLALALIISPRIPV